MRFLWAFLGWLGLFAAVFLVAAVVVNPRREFSGTRFPALILNTRELKADLFDAAVKKSPPTGVIIGSSRSMNLIPAIFDSVTGERFFNFGVFNATMEDDLAAGRYALRNDPRIRDFVIGVDPQSFDINMKPLTELSHNARLSGALDGTLGNPWHDAIHRTLKYRDALTVSYLADVLKSAKNAAHPPEPTYAFDSNGVLLYPKADRAKKNGTYEFHSHYDDCAATAQQEYANYDSLAGSKRAMLDSLIGEATARGIHVVLWSTPFNPLFATALRARPISWTNYQRSVKYLASLARTDMVSYVAEDDPSLLPDPDGWYDCQHFDGENARVVALSLANAVRESHAQGPNAAAAR